MTIRAEVIADSVSELGKRITTLQLRYPKFIHGEFMTHRVFSRNASSSRAIPIERMIKDVLDDPVYPTFWGKNQKGMQAAEECTETVKALMPHEKPDHVEGVDPVVVKSVPVGREEAWDAARQFAVVAADGFAEAGYHKQVVNRLLEPFCHINVVVTATEWSNFFALRLHKDAQPEMRQLAVEMYDAIANSQPAKLKEGQWHLPYVNKDEIGLWGADKCLRVSVARCARVSYLTQDGRKPDFDEDLALHHRLIGAVPLHASPAEHQALPDLISGGHGGGWLNPHLHGNFVGWIQYRKTLTGECQ